MDFVRFQLLILWSILGKLCSQGNVSTPSGDIELDCPDDWREYGHHCYSRNSPDSSSQTWVHARMICIQAGGDLVSFADEDEVNFVIDTFIKTPDSSVSYWLGLTDMLSEDDFEWSDGTPVTYTQWSDGEPNDFGVEDCSEISSWTLRWNDAKCLEEKDWICKRRKGVSHLTELSCMFNQSTVHVILDGGNIQLVSPNFPFMYTDPCLWLVQGDNSSSSIQVTFNHVAFLCPVDTMSFGLGHDPGIESSTIMRPYGGEFKLIAAILPHQKMWIQLSVHNCEFNARPWDNWEYSQGLSDATQSIDYIGPFDDDNNIDRSAEERNRSFNLGFDGMPMGMHLTLEQHFQQDIELNCDELGSFRCKNGACVEPSALCNGINDCMDNSDENICGQPGYDLMPTCAPWKPNIVFTLTNSSTTYILISPNFPHPYPPNLNCVWLINALDANQIMLTLNKFKTQLFRDDFGFGDGDQPWVNTILVQSGTTRLRRLYSHTSHIWIIFKTDHEYMYYGFQVHLQLITDPTVDVDCSPFGFACPDGFCVDYDGICDNHDQTRDCGDWQYGDEFLCGDCFTVLGLQYGAIDDQQISASSFLYEDKGAQYGRLNNDSFWQPAREDSNQWWQVDFNHPMIVSGILIQGSGGYGGGWVSSFKISYSSDGVLWKKYRSSRPGEDEVLSGNVNNHCFHPVLLEPPIQCQYIRIHPVSWEVFLSMRIELLGCHDNECDYVSGISTNKIPDSNITSSSEFNSRHSHLTSRLTLWTPYNTGWIPANDDLTPWIRVQLGSSFNLNAVSTQGCGNDNFWVTRYEIHATSIQDNPDFVALFEGNHNRHGAITNYLTDPILVETVEIRPKSWYRKPCLRFELLGCYVYPYLVCGVGHPSCGTVKNCTLPSARIASVNYPSPYYRKSSCTWKIQASESNKFIALTFLDFDIVSRDPCSQSVTQLAVFDGASVHAAVLGYFCNRNKPSGVIHSSFSSMFLRLLTGTEDPGRGFTAFYEASDFVSKFGSNETGFSCEESWSYNDGNCFRLFQLDRKVRWTSAEEECNSMDGHLASIRDEAEMHFIHQLLIDNNAMGTTYIGLELDIVTGARRWTDGRPLTYADWFAPSGNSHWIKRQPDGGTLEACTMILLANIHSTNHWHDIPCASEEAQQLICVKEAKGRIPARILGESMDRHNPCSSKYFQCSSGECIHKIFTCDQSRDCLDGSDEAYCPTPTIGVVDHKSDMRSGCEPGNVRCRNGDRCISVSYLCDFIHHCEDKSDENICDYPKCTSTQFRCQNGRCIDKSQRCDLHEDCFDKTDEVDCVESSVGFQCYDGTWLPASAKCDGQRDCSGKNWEDEPRHCQNETYDEELFDDMLRCKNGAVTPHGNICHYRIDDLGFPVGCRDMTHLLDCKDVECTGEGRLKCPNAYCIDIEYRCNGLWECPNGEDENNCHNYTCPGLYRCRGNQQCLTMDRICDGVKQCPNGDDEWFCGIQCPDGCNCIGMFYSCQSITWNSAEAAQIPRFLRQLHLSDLTSPVGDHKIRTLEDTILIEPRDFNLIFILDIGANFITELGMKPFEENHNLRTLILQENKITHLQNDVFRGLDSLTHLDISGNPIHRLDNFVFMHTAQLLFLNITKTEILEPKEDVLTLLINLEKLQSDDFLYCCFVRNIPSLKECLPQPDEFSSCQDLMRNGVLRVFMWILGFSAVIGNMFVIIWRACVSRLRRNKGRGSVQSVLVSHLAFADLIMGVYMLTIASADMFYRDRYIAYAEHWKSSIACKIAGFLSVLSSETSVLFLTVISLDRFLCIGFPFSTRRLTEKSARITVLVVWSLGFLISLMPAVIPSYFGDSYYGRSSVCLALPLSKLQPPGWQYSIAIFLALNFIAFTVMLTCYIGIFIVVKTSSQTVKASGKSQADQIQLAARMAFLMGTDCACWMPIIICGILAVTGRWAIPQDIYVWTAVFILPLNSSLNPYLYTILTREVARRKAKAMVTQELTNMGSVIGRGEPTSGLVNATLRDHRDSRLILTVFKERYKRYLLSRAMVKTAEWKGFTDSDVAALDRDVKVAIRCLHEQSLVHGAINEDNILVEKVGESRQFYLIIPTLSALQSASAPDESSEYKPTADYEQLQRLVNRLPRI